MKMIHQMMRMIMQTLLNNNNNKIKLKTISIKDLLLIREETKTFKAVVVVHPGQI